MSATPLLDVSNLESRLYNKRERDLISPTSNPTATTTNTDTYNYHAAQLERFLEEYRCLQKQLTKMKETCDTLCQERGQLLTTSPVTPCSSDSAKNNSQSTNPAVSPNSTQSLEDSVDFRNFESELTKYLVSKGLSQNFSSGVFNNWVDIFFFVYVCATLGSQIKKNVKK